VRGSPVEVREVLTNVVANALDASLPGGAVEVGIVGGESVVGVQVVGRGCGMSADVKAKVFDPFFTTKGIKGNGLGLSIAYGIVKRHGGDIRIDSALGCGTTVTVELPRARAEPVPTTVVELAVEAPRSSYLPDRVLVVDDDAVVGRVLVGMLRQLGVHGELESDPRLALRRVDKLSGQFDAVMSDLHMPNVDGLSLAASIAAFETPPPVVLMSGSLGCEEWAHQSVFGAPGVSQFLAKPFTLGQLREVLEALKTPAARLGAV
jgi:CheY-like chemotaxis protein